MPSDDAPPLSERERIGLQLRALRKDAGLSTAKAAELGDVSVATLGSIERGTHSLTSMASGGLARLPAAFGLTWERFASLIAPVYLPYMPFLGSPAVLSAPSAAGMYVPAPALHRLDTPAGADSMLIRPGDERPGMLAFTMTGNDMTPTIHAGALVLVDTKDTTPRDGEVVLMRGPDGYTVRRVRFVGSQVWLFPDNPAAAPYPVGVVDVIGTAYLVHNPAVRPTLH